MKRLLFLIALAVHVVAQQQYPSFERGLKPDKLYQFNDIDRVGLYNGSLGITLPIGMSYAVDGGLSYQLSISYNSNFWDVDSGTGWAHAYPSRHAAAGLGWTFGFGQFISEDDPTNLQHQNLFQSADGAEYPLTGYEPASSLVWYSKSGNLRLRQVQGNPVTAVEIDFPDGTVQRHEKSTSEKWRLTEIRAPRGTKKVTVEYPTIRPAQCGLATTSWWHIYDGPLTDTSSRHHYVCFKNYDMDDVQRPLVDTVVLEAFGGITATYQFTYASLSGVISGLEYDYTSSNWRTSHSVTVLKSVTLPDGSAYSFGHNQSADLEKVTLPTLGSIEYLYADTTSPAANQCQASFSPGLGLGVTTKGIYQRTVRPVLPSGTPAEAYTWSYTRFARALNTSASNYVDGSPSHYLSQHTCSDPLTPDVQVRVPLYDEMIVRVDEPALTVNGQTTFTRVDSHFSIWAGDYDGELSPAGFRLSEYGYPHGVYDKVQNRYLSQEQYSCVDTSSCTKLRTTYARHENSDPAVATATRLASQRVFYLDDPAGCAIQANGTGCRSTTVDYTDHDGYGHYRSETLSHDFANTPMVRTVTTDWNKTSGASRTITPTDRWVLNTYERRTASENAQTRVDQACFDHATGFLRGTRALTAREPGPTDLITDFRMSSIDANVDRERFFGGDDTPLLSGADSAASLCDALSALETQTPRYEIAHTWQYGTLASSQYAGMTFKTLDLTVDKSGLVASSRDSAGVPTFYQYDTSGRIKKIQPPVTTDEGLGAAEVNYYYANASAANGVLIAAASATQTSGTPPEAVEVVYQYDSLGRLWRQKERMPDGTWSVRETSYDALGRRSSASEPQTIPNSGDELSFSPTIRTTFEYDPFGRTTRIITPDTAKSRVGYLGSREQKRYVTDPGGTERWLGTDTYDGFGRLVQVTERPDTSGDVVTNYSYDAASHLSFVRMQSPGGVVQQRTFDYDGRGFLRWEQHPESGMTSYTYDARGHVLSKNQSAAMSQFDLQYSYDSAERLEYLYARDPGNLSLFRTIKKFQYATANIGVAPVDRRNGKLVVATRYNYPTGESRTGDTLRVSEMYEYADNLGRKTGRTTTIERSPTSMGGPGWETVRSIYQSVTYDELSNLKTLFYPVCVDCGTSPGNPSRNLAMTYTRGRLTSMSDFVPSISYHPNGMRFVLQHSNQMADTQTVDTSGMPRPGTMGSRIYDGCTAPTIVSETSGGLLGTSGTFELWLNLAAGATTPLTVQWFNAVTDAAMAPPSSTSATYQSFVVNAAGQYYAKVSNRCREVRSNTIRVETGSCVAPWIGGLTVVANGSGGYVLTADGHGTGPLTYVWTRTDDGTVLPGNGASITVTPLVYTEYSVKVSHSCSTATDTRTTVVNVQLASPANVRAFREGGSIKITWTAVAAATAYDIERFSAGQGWVVLASDPDAASPYVDTTVTADRTYAYRVVSRNGQWIRSNPSAPDLATMMSFSAVTPGSSILAVHLDELLRAVNAVRAASGWAALTWNTILSAQDEIPIKDGVILGRHVLALRARMNEAIQALGVRIAGYTDSDPVLTVIKAIHITELQERTQ